MADGTATAKRGREKILEQLGAAEAGGDVEVGKGALGSRHAKPCGFGLSFSSRSLSENSDDAHIAFDFPPIAV